MRLVMRKLIFISTTFAFFLVSCNNTSIKEKVVNNDEEQKEIMKQPIMNGIHSSLFKELERIIAYYRDSPVQESPFKHDIFIVYFSHSGIDCYVTIFQSPWYYQKFYTKTLSSYNLDGFSFLNGNMVAFYNIQDKCNKDLVDITKLKKEKPDGFPDENSDIAIHTIYESWGKKYKIHSNDSLELVYSGII